MKKSNSVKNFPQASKLRCWWPRRTYIPAVKNDLAVWSFMYFPSKRKRNDSNKITAHPAHSTQSCVQLNSFLNSSAPRRREKKTVLSLHEAIHLPKQLSRAHLGVGSLSSASLHSLSGRVCQGRLDDELVFPWMATKAIRFFLFFLSVWWEYLKD